MDQVTVRKLDHAGREIAVYRGRVISRDEMRLLLRTVWSRPDLDMGFVVLETGDGWTEYHFPGRWYNIFEMRTANGELKGWYCNITRPPVVIEDEIRAEDLALDLWVAPDGVVDLLDEDEYAELDLTEAEADAVERALAELQSMVGERTPPFDTIEQPA